MIKALIDYNRDIKIESKDLLEIVVKYYTKLYNTKPSTDGEVRLGNCPKQNLSKNK